MPLPQDLERFRFYARKVRRLILRAGDSSDVKSHTLLFLSKALGGGPIVPSVQILEWVQSSLIDYDILHFISPSIRTLEISIEGYEQSESDISPLHRVSFYALLEQISLAVPNLQALALWSFINEFHYSLIPFTICRDLRKVTLGSLQFKGQHAQFHALASIEKLTDLHITVLDDDELSPEEVAAFQGLDSLEKLSIECTDTWPVTDVLGVIGPAGLRYPDLKILYIDNRFGTTSVTRLSDLTQVVRSRFGASLEELTLTCTRVADLEQDNPSPLQLVRPLLQMHLLRVVKIETSETAHLSWSDDDLASLASAWPMLVLLEISWNNLPLAQENGDTVPAVPTLGVLPHIVKSCPYLRRLGLTALRLTWNEGVKNPTNVPHTIFIVLSIKVPLLVPMIPTLDVASFLDRLFPKLDAEGAGEYHGDTWKTILSHVKVLQTNRNKKL